MAEEEVKEEGQDLKGEKKSSNLLMIIIIVVLILVILVGAVVAILLMGGDDEVIQEQSAPQVKERSVQQVSRGSSSLDEETRKLTEIGTLYPLDTFTVNLKSDAGHRYLKVTMSLELDGDELSIELDKKAPVIRDRIIRILTSKTLEEISSRKGKDKVSQQIEDTLNAMLTDGRIKGIYFTEFVIQ
jgi:flagellar FliL protein